MNLEYVDESNYFPENDFQHFVFEYLRQNGPQEDYWVILRREHAWFALPSDFENNDPIIAFAPYQQLMARIMDNPSVPLLFVDREKVLIHRFRTQQQAMHFMLAYER